MYHRQRDEYLSHGYDTFSANLLPTAPEIEAAAARFLAALFAEPAARLGKPRWGFKEVRCGAEVGRFVRRLFSGALIVHLTRDPVDCFLSLKEWEDGPDAWTRADTEEVLRDWQRINASFLPSAGDDPGHDHLTVRFEGLVGRRGGRSAASAAPSASTPPTSTPPSSTAAAAKAPRGWSSGRGRRGARSPRESGRC